jgi:hypothetical protein
VPVVVPVLLHGGREIVAGEEEAVARVACVELHTPAKLAFVELLPAARVHFGREGRDVVPEERHVLGVGLPYRALPRRLRLARGIAHEDKPRLLRQALERRRLGTDRECVAPNEPSTG